MSKYVEENLENGEQILVEAKRTGLLLLGKIITSVGWMVLGAILGIVVNTACFAIVPLAVIYLVCQFIKFNREKLTLTSNRVIFRSGVFNTRSSDIPYEKVEKVEIVQSFWGKIFHFSNIVVETGVALECDALDGVIDGDKIKNLIVTQADEKKKAFAQEQARATAAAMREAMLSVQESSKQE